MWQHIEVDVRPRGGETARRHGLALGPDIEVLPVTIVDPLAMALQCFRSCARDHTRTWGPKPPRQGLYSCAGARA